MARKSMIRSDKHGLYVLTNGRVFRPQQSKWASPRAYHIKNGYTTELHKDMVVMVQHISGTALCSIQWAGGMGCPAREEEWCSHGSYAYRATEDCWNPKDVNATPRVGMLCYLCGKSCPEDEFCFGCQNYICNACAVSVPSGRHEPAEHQQAQDDEE